MKQTPGRKQFTFYRSYIENVMKLPKCRRFETLLGIIFYALDGTEPDLSGASDAVFGCIRPNIDSSRVKAETALRTREKAGAAEAEEAGEPCALPPRGESIGQRGRKSAPQENKKKNKNKNESEKEREEETEAEEETEGSAAPVLERSRTDGAAADGDPGLSLSALERERDFSEGSEAPEPGWSMTAFDGGMDSPADAEEPENRLPYSVMLENDCALRVLWKTLMDQERCGGPMSRKRKRSLLRELHSAPPGQRTGILAGRLRAGSGACPP